MKEINIENMDKEILKDAANAVIDTLVHFPLEYKIITFFGKRKMEHRKVYEDNFGKIPEGFDIHHQDGNKLNNNLNNLHLMTKSEHTKLHWEEKII